MKFDTIKQNAKKIYVGSLGPDGYNRSQGAGPLAKGSTASLEAVLPFILATASEREEMSEFAKHVEAPDSDLLAKAAQSNGKDHAWNKVVLKARQAGLDLIDKWDVRKVGKLIELFPESVPAQYRNKILHAYMADNENCDWMITTDRTAA